MNALLEGKVAVVTAGASGGGFGIAQRLLAAGANVWVCDIADEALASAKESAPGINGGVADVGNPDDVKAFFTQVKTQGGAIDILVNNAGIAGRSGPVESVDLEDWKRTLEVNLSGPLYCLQQVVPTMKEQGTGAIINISTASIVTNLPQRSAYIASKAGLEGLTKAWARELGPAGIRVNAIRPGAIDNPRGRALVVQHAHKSGSSLEEAEKSLLKYCSMGTWIHPHELGDACTFLASNAAKHITGQILGVCGQMEWEE